MDVLAHLNLSLFPLVIVAIVYFDSLRMGGGDLESRLFRLVALAALGTIVAEALTWIPDGASFPFAGLLLDASMVVYLLLAVSVCLLWLLYVLSKVRGLVSLDELRGAIGACAVAYGLYALVVVTAPWTDLLFVVDEANVYRRGILYALPYAFMGAVMAACVVAAARRWLAETRIDRKRSYLYLALFGALPIVGLCVQQVWLEWWLAWPFVALAILLAYVNIQNVRGAADALTGLGNRSLLDQRLAEAWERGEADGPWCLIMVDVDDFKSVNDRFGHAFGDEALCLVADNLRETFDDASFCLARFGGDEFAVIAPCDGEEGLERWLGGLREARERTAAALAPRPFSFTAAGACFDASSQGGVEQLVAAADAALYRQKGARKASRTRGGTS